MKIARRQMKVEVPGHPRASIVIDKNNKLYLNGRELGIAQVAGALGNF